MPIAFRWIFPPNFCFQFSLQQEVRLEEKATQAQTSAIARDTLAEYLDAQEMRSATLEAFFSQTVMQRFQPADNNIERARK